MADLGAQTVGLELSREQYLRLSAESRRTGQSRIAILRGWILPLLDGLPPAEFESDDEPDDQ